VSERERGCITRWRQASYALKDQQGPAHNNSTLTTCRSQLWLTTARSQPAQGVLGEKTDIFDLTTEQIDSVLRTNVYAAVFCR
jgi:hypothetical protein